MTIIKKHTGWLCYVVATSLLLAGCYTATQRAIDNFPAAHPAQDESLILRLSDGTILEVKAYHHVIVSDSTEFIYGFGTERKSQHNFIGKIDRQQLDSVKIMLSSSQSPNYLLCWKKDGTSIAFWEEDYLWIKANSQRGFWCTGILTRNGEQTVFKGRLEKSQISEMKIERFDVLKTALLASPILLLLVIPKDWKPFRWLRIDF